MKAPGLIALTTTAFAIGAWLGRGGMGTRIDPKFPRQSAIEADASASPAPTALRAGGENPADEHRMRFASALHDRLPLRRRAHLAEALGDFTAAEMPGAIARAEKLPPDYLWNAVEALVARWFEFDPAAAARWCRQRPNHKTLCIWARHQPEVVLRELETFSAVKVTWSEHGLDRIIAPTAAEQASILRALPPGENRDELLGLAVEHWAGEDSSAAWAFAGSLPAGELRERVKRETLLGWARRDPAQAIALAGPLLSSLPVGVRGNTFILDLTTRLAEHDPAAALRWVEDIPAGFQSVAAITAACALAKVDPVAALDWTRAQGLEVARGIRIKGRRTATVLGDAMREHPAQTTAWLLALPSGEERDGLIERAAFHRMGRLPPDQTNTGAEPWMRALHRAMPAESRERLERFMGEKAAALRGP